jgi:hypothetical protein
MGAVFMVNNATISARTHHIDTRWHFVRQFQGELIDVVLMRSEDNWSDGMTRNVITEIYESHSGQMVVSKKEL